MHWRGLPRRWNKRHPLYSWQIRLLKALADGIRYIYILKPPKLGATELLLCYAVWKALTDPTWTNGQVGILVGTSIGETEQMIRRCKEILALKDSNDVIVRNARGEPIYKVPLHFSYNNKKEFTVNTVRFVAHPAGHYDAIRAKPNMKFILGDEIAFFVRKKEEQQEIRSAFEHYKSGGDTIVVLITTAGPKPQGFAYEIFKEEPSLYTKFILTKEDGLEVHPESGTSLLNAKDLEEKRLYSPAAYRREIEMQWESEHGNVYDPAAIEKAIELGKTMNPDKILPEAYKTQGIDPGFGSSSFGVVVIQQVDSILQVVYADEHERPDINDEAYAAAERITTWPVNTTQCDAAFPAFISLLKKRIGENPKYDDTAEETIKTMRVKPISFNKHHKAMLGNSKMLVEKGWVAIHPKFSKLITAMRTAIAEDYVLNKEETSYDNVLDAFRLASKGYSVGGKP